MLLGFLIASFFLPSQQGDGVRVHLKNGLLVEGKLLDEQEKFVIVEIDLGELLIRSERIDRFEKGLTFAKIGGGKKEPDPKQSTPPGKRIEPKKVETAPPREEPLDPAEEPEDPPVRSLVTEVRNKVAAAGSDPGVYEGRLMDRYSWIYALDVSGRITLFALIWCLAWIGFLVGSKIVDLERRDMLRSVSAAFIWVILFTGVLLIPEPNALLLAVIAFCLLVAWIVTARSILRASWFQSGVLLILGCLGFSLTMLIVEIGQSVLELT